MRPCSCVSTPEVAAAAAIPSTKMPVARSIATSETVRYERLEYSERTVNTCGVDESTASSRLRPRGRRARRADRLVRLVEQKRLPSLALLLGQLALAPLFVVRTAALDGGTRAHLVDPALEARERRPHLL